MMAFSQLAKAANSTSNDTNSSLVATNASKSVFCDDNSTACQRQKKEIADSKEQLREEVRSPDPGTPLVPKGVNATIKTRTVTIPLSVNYSWAKANEAVFKSAVLADLNKTLPFLYGRSKVMKYSSAGVTVGVIGDASSDLVESLGPMLKNGMLNFSSLANVTGVDPQKISTNNGSNGSSNGSMIFDAPKQVLIKPVKKALDLREMRKRSKVVLPETAGLNTTLDMILTRAAMRDVWDPAKDIPDGKTQRERRIEFVTDEFMGLIAANLKKATKFDSKNTQAVNELILQTHSPQAPVAKQFLSDLAVAFDKASAPAGAQEL